MDENVRKQYACRVRASISLIFLWLAFSPQIAKSRKDRISSEWIETQTQQWYGGVIDVRSEFDTISWVGWTEEKVH
jgi:hypothetical protein